MTKGLRAMKVDHHTMAKQSKPIHSCEVAWVAQSLSQSNQCSRNENSNAYSFKLSAVTSQGNTVAPLNAASCHRSRHRKKNRKASWFGCCRCSCLQIIATLFLIFILIIALTAILLATLKPVRTTTVKPINPLRWKTAGKTVAGIVGSAGSGSNQLKYPWSLAIDALYTLYIGDRQNNRIQKYLSSASSGTTVAGRANSVLGADATSLAYPGYIYLDSDGSLYVPDTSNHRLQFWLPTATSGTTVAGISGSSGSLLNQLSSPFGVTRDSPSGTLYVADSSNHRIMSYLSGASAGTIVAGNNGMGTNNTQLFYPRNIHFDSVTNSLIILNRGANNIVRWVIGDTRWTLMAGSINGTAGNSSTLFRQPGNMIFDLLGNMYVSDDQNHRTQLFYPGASEGITIAGVTGIPGNDSEHLYYPSSMALDNQLNLYVVDQYNHRIQMFERY